MKTEVGKIYRFKKHVSNRFSSHHVLLHTLRNDGIWVSHSVEVMVDTKKIRFETLKRGEYFNLVTQKVEPIIIGLLFYKEQPDESFPRITKEDNLIVCIALDAPSFEEDTEELDYENHKGEIWNPIEKRWRWY
jgi:hypothetical protein